MQTLLLTTLIQLEKRARHAETPAELGFVMVNETLRLVNYRQAFLWEIGPGQRIRIKSVSGVEQPDVHSPLLLFLRKVLKELLREDTSREIRVIQENTLKEAYQADWRENIRGHALWSPLITRDKRMIGGLLLTRGEPYQEQEIALTGYAADAYAHAWDALVRGKSPLSDKIRTGWRKQGLRFAGLILFILLMALPVRLSVLAPFEIIPFNFMIVSAPADGVIRDVFVEPNQRIKKGDLLFALDDTAVRNQYEVAKKALDAARVRYQRAAQKAFSDRESRGALSFLRSQVEQKSAEADYLKELSELGQVRAIREGVAVFGDIYDWIGKPVAAGEKIMIIADPAQVEAEIRIPVKDAINLSQGAETHLFLNTAPDNPLPATLRQADYEARITSEGILAFRVKASLFQKATPPRIGLRGTAKICGKKVKLWYYLMRRPLAALRQGLGI